VSIKEGLDSFVFYTNPVADLGFADMSVTEWRH
jgi:hypothetical protein